MPFLGGVGPMASGLAFEVTLSYRLYWISCFKTPYLGHGCSTCSLLPFFRLPGQCQYLGLPVADYFKQWINLKKVLCLSPAPCFLWFSFASDHPPLLLSFLIAVFILLFSSLFFSSLFLIPFPS